LDAQEKIFAPTQNLGMVRIVPLGGCGEFGMNLTCFLSGGKLFVVDAGIRFPDAFRLGVDAVLPDVDKWFAEAGGVYAYILTHGHEDHIGAMPHILQKWPAPVYGTAWTIELLRNKLFRLGRDPEQYKLKVVAPGDHVVTEGFDAEYVHINHSIPMACSLNLRFPGLTIFHTGDFKFEEDPIIERPADLERLKRIGDEGVDLLLADSTNAEKDGFCPAENSIYEPLLKVINQCERAAVVTTFSSNLWRIKTIVDVCRAAGRRLYITGGGLENTLNVAKAVGIYEVPPELRIADELLASVPRDRLMVLATGCQGERRSSLARIAAGEHRFFRLNPGDTVIWSSRLIPGNEKAVISLSNNVQRLGAKVITAREAPGIHVSGHAYGGDIGRLLQLIRPKNFLPIHGAFSQLNANYQRPLLTPNSVAQAQIVESGDVIDVDKEGTTIIGRLEIELKFLESDGSGLMSYGELRERLRIGELGMARVDGVYNIPNETWVVEPTIELIGIGFPENLRKSDWLCAKASKIKQLVPQLLLQKNLTAAQASEEIRQFIRRELQRILRKKPVVSVKIHCIDFSINLLD